MADEEHVPYKPPFTAYVYNIPVDASAEDIRDFFSGLQITTYSEHTQHLHHIYVTFKHRRDLIAALELDQKFMDGHALTINIPGHPRKANPVAAEPAREPSRQTFAAHPAHPKELFAPIEQVEPVAVQPVQPVQPVGVMPENELEIWKKKFEKSNKRHGSTLLHYVCLNGVASVVQLLLQRGEDCNVRDKSGRTPLHNASKEGHVNIVEMLLDHKADMNAKDDADRTPLHLASLKCRWEVIELLVKRKADIHLKDYKGLTPVDCIMSERKSVLCVIQ